MMGLSRKMPGTNCIFDEMSVIYPNYTNAAGKEKKGSGTAVTPRGGPEGPQPLRSGRGVGGGAKPSSDWGDASKGGKASLRLQSYPGALPRGRVVFRPQAALPSSQLKKVARRPLF